MPQKQKLSAEEKAKVIENQGASLRRGGQRRRAHAGIRHTDAAELSFTNDGRITETVRNTFQQVCGDLGAGVYATAGEAARAFVQQCAG